MRVRQALLQQAGAPGPAADALNWPAPQPPATADAQLQAVGSGSTLAANAALYPSPYPASGGSQAWALPLAAAGIGVAGALLAATAISCITLAACAARRAGRNDRSVYGLGSGCGTTGLAAGAMREVLAIGEGRSLCSASSSDALRKGRDPDPSPTSNTAGLRFGMDQQNALPGAAWRQGSGRGSLSSAALNTTLTPNARATAARTAHTDHVPGPLPDLTQAAGPSLGFLAGSGFRPQAARLPSSAWLQPPTPPGDPCITPRPFLSPAACPGMAPTRPLTRSGSGSVRGLGSVNSLPGSQPAGAGSALENASGNAKAGTRGFDELDMWQSGGNPGGGGYLRAPALAVNLPPSPFVALTLLPFEG